MTPCHGSSTQKKKRVKLRLDFVGDAISIAQKVEQHGNRFPLEFVCLGTSLPRG